MKRIIAIVGVCLFFTLGCKDDKIASNNGPGSTSALNSPAIISNVGSQHNTVLDIMGQDTTFSIADTAESVRLFKSSISNLVVLNSNYDSTSIYNSGIDFAYYLAGKNIDTIFKAYYDATFPTISSNLSAQEIDLVTRAMDFLYGYNFSSLSASQSCDLIISKADSLLIEYNAIDWDTVSSASYMKGELAGGLLYIMKSSAQHWKNYATDSSETSGFVVILTADAGGYVGGWITAVVSELWDNGHLDIKNQHHRIGAGVAGAIGGSTVGGILKLRGWWWKSH